MDLEQSWELGGRQAGKRGWERRASAERAGETSNKKKRADNWQNSEVDGLVAAYRQIHDKMAVAGKRVNTVFRSAHEKWKEIHQLLYRMGIDRQPKEIERKWSNLYTGFRQIAEFNKRLAGRGSYWDINEQTKKEKSKAKELPSIFRVELYDAMAEFLGDDCDMKLRASDPPSTQLASIPSCDMDVPLPMDKLGSHTPPLNGSEDKRPQLVLVAIGDFNPPTFLHLRLFEVARDWLAFEGYNVLGGYMSPFHDAHKQEAPAEHRVKLCQLATSDSQFVMVDPWEARQVMSQSIVQVLSRIEVAINGTVHTGEERVKVMLLCGSDVYNLCLPLVLGALSRDGVNSRKLIFENDLLYEKRRNIVVVDDWIQNDISSTKLRRMMARGLSVKYLTPDMVIKYMTLNHLYKYTNY